MVHGWENFYVVTSTADIGEADKAKAGAGHS
jgi:hypothetical protein